MLAHNSPEDFLRSVEDAKVARRRQKDAELALETRPLQPWERYRALIDHHDSLQDEAEHTDKKTRFALLILGSLNALNLAIAMRGDALGLLPVNGAPVVVYLACYALVSLACCLFAVTALKPRAHSRTDATYRSHGRVPLRFPQPALTQTLDEYCENWRTAEVGPLTQELASLAYSTARANADRVEALGRVYVGLYVLVALTAALVAALAWSGLLSAAIS
jgi:hypothetical protein